MADKIQSRIESVMRSVFGMENDDEISPDSSPQTISNWDSLRHIQLVVSLEEEFQLEFSDGEITQLVTPINIKEIIEEKKS
tara:strand:+ start:410 stop:652 length:243 start_codon:yes stop_codon:yes gene_type:complete